MKFLDPDTESAVRDFLARIPADIRLDRAILFGSRARGEHRPDSDADAVSEIKGKGAKLEPISLEEIRREARENWLQLRQRTVGVATKGVGHSKDADRGTKEDQSRSIDDDVDE
jgi:Nucleotidyltransferase domain